MLSLEDAISGFLTAARARNLSRKSLAWYGIVMRQFREFVGPDKDVRTVTAADLRVFLAARLSNHSPRSVANYRAALRVLFRWFLAEEYVDRDVSLRVQGSRVPRYVPVVLSPEEVATFLKAWPGSGYVQVRNRVAVMMLLDTGLRVAELCSLTVGSADLIAGTVRVFGKGRKEREVPISLPLRAELRRFLRARETARIPSTLLFASFRGGPWATNSVEHTFRRAAEAVGLDTERMKPHNFRRTAATTLLRQGASLEHVRAILGHSDVTTTSRYLGLDLDDLKAVHASASPLTAFGLARTGNLRSLHR